MQQQDTEVLEEKHSDGQRWPEGCHEEREGQCPVECEEAVALSGTDGGLEGHKVFAQCPFIVPLVKRRWNHG